MTDLEICKRIAEIEGLNPFIDSLYPSTSNMVVFVPIDDDSDEVYDPLGDDLFAKALCFELMVKYNLSISKNLNGKYMCSTPNCAVTTVNENPQRAILLAIIEAHTND